ncbi:CBS domain-containing protein [Paenibacillus albiflavus]|uniref:CBS domain-containing protein n=1 Tax=Paenibacillus albiflavus TaxID=2545760 RepID=A0A4R4EBN5_9BACL|nr:CBS domain-containing protein [Paenibacillus albiflavus]
MILLCFSFIIIVIIKKLQVLGYKQCRCEVNRLSTKNALETTKHEQILNYITELKLGSKISVRKIAKNLSVSEGTAYRAIKEAESIGLVSTKERIGTVRVEKKLRQNIDNLTFEEVVRIVEGVVLGGVGGLNKTLNKFVIGAMQQDAMMRYIEPGSLLIVGNRNKAHICALQSGAAVLITGGFSTSEEVKALADKLRLPIISSTYDTFTVASMINRALYDRLIKKKIMIVEDIMKPDRHVYTLKASALSKEWNKLVEETHHSRYPVVDEWNRVIGIVTTKDVVRAPEGSTIEKLMTRNPLTVNRNTSVASAAHMMVWEGIELLPVVDGSRKIVGVISRQDVLKAMQHIQKEQHSSETFEMQMWGGFTESRNESGGLVFQGSITPQMTNYLGTVSEGLLMTLMNQAAFRVVQDYKKGDLVLDNISSYFIRPLQIENVIEIHPTIIDITRKFVKIDVNIYCNDTVAARAMLTAQFIDQS